MFVVGFFIVILFQSEHLSLQGKAKQSVQILTVALQFDIRNVLLNQALIHEKGIFHYYFF